MSKATNKLLKEVKKQNQDFEWYPTTNEIIDAMYWSIKEESKNCFYNDDLASRKQLKYEYKNISMLDIGAGNCKLKTRFQELSTSLYEEDTHGNPMNGNQLDFSKYMAIEKSTLLIEAMPSDVFIVGTDFQENTLIDKEADVVFCNPPYSEYAQWSEKIITESNAKVIYLVIPKRWGSNRGIMHAIKQRRASISVVGKFDFLESEDRKARAYVSLVKIDLKGKSKYSHRAEKAEVDPFELWFDKEFKLNTSKKSDSDYTAERKATVSRKETLKKALVDAPSLIDALVKLYNDELLHLINNYKKVAELDSEILKELNVDVASVMSAFREKIKGLKSFYWREVFENLEQIKARLTSRSRTALVEKLLANTNIDFTQGNIRSILIWVIKNANKYFDGQMLEMYDDFTTVEGIKMYKSNMHWEKDTWRYATDLHEKGVKYTLDYRIVLHGFNDYMDKSGMINSKQLQYIDDLTIIAKNLGFKIDMDSICNDLKTGEKDNIYTSVSKDRKLKKGQKTHYGKIDDVFELDESGGEGKYQYLIDEQYVHYSLVRTDEDIFTTVKVYKNGNIHFQLNQNFIKKLNLEVSRLRGWIKSPEEAAQEFDISIEEANEYWKSSFTLLPSSLNSLLPAPKDEVEHQDEKHSVTISGQEVEISFEADGDTIHCGDMVEYKDEWVEVTFSNDNHLALETEETECFTKLLSESMDDITGHKSHFKRIELIKSIYDDLATPSMEYYAQRNLIASDARLDDYEIHLYVLNYAYWLYELKHAPIKVVPQVTKVAETPKIKTIDEKTIPANIIIASSTISVVDYKENNISEANANGTLF